MDEMERISCLPRLDGGPGDHGAVILSVDRGLWGEVSGSLRSVCVTYRNDAIDIYGYFTGHVSDDDKDSMETIGASVAADFPGCVVAEHCVASDPLMPVGIPEQGHVVFLGKEDR